MHKKNLFLLAVTTLVCLPTQCADSDDESSPSIPVASIAIATTVAGIGALARWIYVNRPGYVHNLHSYPVQVQPVPTAPAAIQAKVAEIIERYFVDRYHMNTRFRGSNYIRWFAIRENYRELYEKRDNPRAQTKTKEPSERKPLWLDDVAVVSCWTRFDGRKKYSEFSNMLKRFYDYQKKPKTLLAYMRKTLATMRSDLQLGKAIQPKMSVKSEQFDKTIHFLNIFTQDVTSITNQELKKQITVLPHG